MISQPSVTMDIDQNRYLPVGGTAMDAIITVAAETGGGARPSGARTAEVIMIDCSGSMGDGKLTAAKAASGVALDTLRDGVEFAIIAGTHTAWMVYPDTPGTVVASAATRSAAKAHIARLRADGGTAMGTWLKLASTVLGNDPGQIRHAILLTDGENEHETPQQFEQALAGCSGRFTCDSRGVGRGWRADDLMKVAGTLLGTADGMKDSAGLAVDFQSIIETAMGKTAAEVALRVWTPTGARIRFLKQMYPKITDLTDRRTAISHRIGDYPTGAWGTESREYHLCVELAPGEPGDELLVARVRVVQDGRELAQGLVEAEWTEDATRSTTINRKVAHYSGQSDLAEAIQEGLSARDAGDLDRATAKLGHAVALATTHGREDTARMLARVVDVVDPVSGTVRLRSHADNRDLDIDSEIAKLSTARTRCLALDDDEDEGR
ncbi:MAG: VWA domain-containing protein [Dactylosporangium sp.]|nr:VWA domain-containing protein [Dactylosporangium sp.]NNJ61129.1 VWA domain-containing protein [Dactylosporangium sp.]